MNYAVMAEDVCEFMRARHIEHAHVLGHSMGGKTAMQLALRNPEKVDRLVVVDIAPRAYSPRHGQIFEGALAVDLAACQNRGDVEHALAPYIPERTIRQFLLKNLTRNAAGSLQWKLNLRDIFKNCGRLGEALASEQPFDKPALFIRGEASKYLRDSDWEFICQLFPQAEQRAIAGASHWVHADAPQAFIEAVLDFLKPPGRA
jgi:esterase